MFPGYMIGRRLERVVASWHRYGTEPPSGPLDVWLIDSEAVATRVTTGSDWCLVVETSDPHTGYDMAESGRVEVTETSGTTPFAGHIGETVQAVSEEGAPGSGRTALEITFDSGTVRCETWSGELRLSGA
ncbi:MULTISPECIES: hypothetical protein [Streptomyces]|uniref:hypothetical protein n=1 Tax=Streptomyces TaxID=1883 RepID=UPI001FB076B7|nr:hypothetical protein [Streptomyces sp. LaPpAH-199]